MDQPTAAGSTPSAPTGGAKTPQNPLTVFDRKTIQTIQWSAIASAAAAAIDGVFGYVAGRLATRAAVAKLGGSLFGGAYGGLINENIARSGAYAFSPRAFIMDLIWGAVVGAIGGWVLAKFFPVLLRWNQQFVRGKLDTFFKLLFYPTVVAAILLALIGTAASFMTGFSAWIVMIIGLLASRFVYAKVMDAKVGRLYAMK